MSYSKFWIVFKDYLAFFLAFIVIVTTLAFSIYYFS